MPMNSYNPTFIFRNGHVQTLYPSLFRKVRGVFYRRLRIDTPDGDFLDLDWSPVGSRRLAVISHGLEGNSQRHYVRGMVKALNEERIDALAWNYRGCSGEPNRLARMYHNGVIDDLHWVVTHALGTGRYAAIYLVGFSLGGNLSLLYLGKQANVLSDRVRGAVVFSAPCDLSDAAGQMAKPCNAIYMHNFLASLHLKIRAKQQRYPEALNDVNYHEITTFRQFDDRYTAPLHGFESAHDYWARCSSKPWLESIRIPTLIVNAANDPFLAGGCYPVHECRRNPKVTLEIPRHGGHVGFVAFNNGGRYWSEHRALEFLRLLDEK